MVVAGLTCRLSFGLYQPEQRRPQPARTTSFRLVRNVRKQRRRAVAHVVAGWTNNQSELASECLTRAFRNGRYLERGSPVSLSGPPVLCRLLALMTAGSTR